jgi:hypothetical protein
MTQKEYYLEIENQNLKNTIKWLKKDIEILEKLLTFANKYGKIKM